MSAYLTHRSFQPLAAFSDHSLTGLSNYASLAHATAFMPSGACTTMLMRPSMKVEHSPCSAPGSPSPPAHPASIASTTCHMQQLTLTTSLAIQMLAYFAPSGKTSTRLAGTGEGQNGTCLGCKLPGAWMRPHASYPDRELCIGTHQAQNSPQLAQMASGPIQQAVRLIHFQVTSQCQSAPSPAA